MQSQHQLAMKSSVAIKNRHISELLEDYDDEEPLDSSQHMDIMSLSSMAEGDTFHPKSTIHSSETEVSATEDRSELSPSGKSTWFLLLSIALIFSIALSYVAMIHLSPSVNSRFDGMDENERLEKARERLKSKSTAENLINGAVASDHSVCSTLGHRILNIDHGNVVDAAVAVALCLGVCNPASSGIGGGMFMLIHIDKDAKDKSVNTRLLPRFHDERNQSVWSNIDADGKITLVIDAREVAPQKAYRDMFRNTSETASTIGGKAIAVPGELFGLDVAHALFGKLSWDHVVTPAIELARNGVKVSSSLADAISKHTEERWNNLELRRFLSKDGLGETPLEEGDTIKNEALAKFLESVLQEGAGALYNGSHSKRFIDDLQRSGSILTREDLENYVVSLRSPLIARDVFGYTMVGAPPPSSGGATVIGAARFLADFGKVDENSIIDGQPHKVHRMVEAMRHAFAIRMSLSDPNFNRSAVQAAVTDLVYNSYMSTLRMMSIEDSVLSLSKYGGEKWAKLRDEDGRALDYDDGNERSRRDFEYLEDKGTSHVSIMDNMGNAVSMTSSINTYFGSGVLSASTGILLNSQMDDFATPTKSNFYGVEPVSANYIAPGKKPLSSMSPTLIFEPNSGRGSGTNSDPSSQSLGNLHMIIGASGGPKIISAVLQVFLNYAVEKMDLFTSVLSARIHDQLLYHSKASTLFESALIQSEDYLIEVPSQQQLELEMTGHSLLPYSQAGSVQVVAWNTEQRTMSAVADVRKGGRPDGA